MYVSIGVRPSENKMQIIIRIVFMSYNISQLFLLILRYEIFSLIVTKIHLNFEQSLRRIFKSCFDWLTFNVY